MIIGSRPLLAVAAALGVALGTVGLDRACSSDTDAAGATQIQPQAPALVRRGCLAVRCAPDRDLSLSCRLPPACSRVGFRV